MTFARFSLALTLLAPCIFARAQSVPELTAKLAAASATSALDSVELVPCLYATPGESSPPEILEEALNEVVHPATAVDTDGSEQPQVRRRQFGKSKLDCIMLSKPLKPNGDSRFHMPGELPLGLFPTYCFAPDSRALRIAFSLGSQAIISNSVGVFQKKNVATSSSIYENGELVANSRVLLLRGEAIQQGCSTLHPT